MRIGGAFPYGLPPIPIVLGTGTFVFIPPGNWIAQVGVNTVVEWFDQQQQIWRTLVAASTAEFVSSDGTNFRFRNVTGAMTIASFAAGSGATNGIGSAATGVNLTPSAPGANGRSASLFPIVGGQVGAAATITAAGSGLLVPPLLIVSPPPLGGIPATMTCAISAGAVASVTVVSQGAGYTAVPTVAVVPQPAGYFGATLPPPATVVGLGSLEGPPPAGGAMAYPYQWPPWLWLPVGVYTTLPVITAQALAGSGTLTGVGVIDNGAAYTGTPTVTVTGAGAATITANAVTAAANDTSYLQAAVQ